MNSLLLAFLVVPALAAAEPARLSLQLGHGQSVSAVSLSEDGRFLMTFGEDKTNILWDADTGAELRRYGNMPCYPNAGLLLKAKDLFIMAGRSCAGRIAVYQLSTGKQLAYVPAHTGYINRLVLSPDGKLLASAGDDGKVRLWSVGTWTPVRTFSRGDNTMSVAFSKDGALLAAVGGYFSHREGSDYSIRVWEVKTGKERAKFESRIKVDDAAFLPDGRLVTVASRGMYVGPNRYMVSDGGVWYWDIAAGTRTYAAPLAREFEHKYIAALPGGRFLTSSEPIVATKDGGEAFTSSGSPEISEWDPAQPSTSTYRIKDRSIVTSVGIDFKRNGVNHHNGLVNWDHAARRWTLGKGGGVKLVFAPSIQPATDVEVSPLGDRIVSAHHDGAIRFWSFDAAELMRSSASAHIGSASSMRFDPTGRHLVTTGYDNQVLDWDIASVSIKAAHSGKGGTGAAIDSAGARIYAAGADEVLELDAATKAVLRTWKLPTDPQVAGSSSDLLFIEEAGLLAVALPKGDVQLIDVRSGNMRERLKNEGWWSSLAYDPKNGVLAASGKKTITLWELASGKKLRTFQAAEASGMAFSPDGRRIYTAGNLEDALNEWDVATGKHVRRFGSLGGRPALAKVAVFPKGDWLITGSNDGALRLWDARTGTLVAQLYGMNDSWAVLAPDGRFDGDALARKRMHLVRGFAAYPLDAYMDRYFTPGLLEQILSRKAAGKARASSFSLKPPPTSTIAGAADGALLDQDELRVTVSASDQGGGVDEIRLYNNGRRVSAAGSAAGPAATFTVTLARGKNELEAVSFSKDRVQGQTARLTVRRQVAPGVSGAAKLFAAGAGIGAFANSSVQPLRFPPSDAKDIVALLGTKGGAYYSDIKAFTKIDAEATKAGVLLMFQSLEQSSVDDTVVIMLSAHGGLKDGEWLFIPHDWRGDRQTGLSARELAAALAKIPAQHVVLFIDACHSGGALASFGEMQASLRGATARLSRDLGLYVIAASQKEQVAQESGALQHGVLTYAAIEALSGKADADKDNSVSAQELVRYVRWRVPAIGDELSRASGKPMGQMPDIEAIGADFALLPSAP
ncbi:MAG: caspase family protein [Elusimicrobia bacterium]|nr:caspase family protein [Elusimicrobiota bacterium]